MIRRIGLLLASGILAGCASVNPKPAFVDVETTLSERTGQHARWIRTAADAPSTRLPPTVDRPRSTCRSTTGGRSVSVS